MDERKKALESATVVLIPLKDTSNKRTTQTDKDGLFTFSNNFFGYYRLRISYTGMQIQLLDSIYFRQERFDFNLNDIVLKSKKGKNFRLSIR